MTWDGHERRDHGRFDHGAIMERLNGIEKKLDEFVGEVRARAERNSVHLVTMAEKISTLEVSIASTRIMIAVLKWCAGAAVVIVGAVVWLTDRLPK